MGRTKKSEWEKFGDPRDMSGSFRPKRRLAEELKRQNLSQQDLAARLGVRRETVNLWIAGSEYMRNVHVIRAATVLGVAPTYLLELQVERTGTPDWMAVAGEFEKRRSLIGRTVEVLEDPSKSLEFIDLEVAPEDGVCDELFYQAWLMPFSFAIRPPANTVSAYPWGLITFSKTPLEGMPPLAPNEEEARLDPFGYRYSSEDELYATEACHPTPLQVALLAELGRIDGDYRDMRQFAKDMADYLKDVYSFAAPDLVGLLTPILMTLASMFPGSQPKRGDDVETGLRP